MCILIVALVCLKANEAKFPAFIIRKKKTKSALNDPLKNGKLCSKYFRNVKGSL